MKVFISCADPKGAKEQRSRIMAKCLRSMLPEVIQAVQPWAWFEDAKAGENLLDEIHTALNDANFGILCLTRENMHSPWIHYEAGWLAKKLGEARVCPYLLDFTRSELPPPLSQFVGARADEDGTLQLVKAINSAVRESGEPHLDDDKLKRVVKNRWRSLSRCLPGAEAPTPGVTYDQLIRDFKLTGDTFDEHRGLLHNLIRLPSLIKKVIEDYESDRYEFEEMFDLAYAVILRSREGSYPESLIVGNLREFYEENYSPDELRNFMRYELEPILKRNELSADEKELRLLKRIENAEIAVFARFHRELATRLVNFKIS